MRSNLHLQVDVVEDADEEQVAEATASLRSALLELDIDSVDYVRMEAPEGAKSGTLAAFSSLLVTVAASPEIMSSLVAMVRGWLTLRSGRTVTLTLDGDKLEITGVSTDLQQQVVENWLRRHDLVGA
jgi:hypothetical protein